MGKIVAIGGGEIGRPGYPVETTKLIKRLLSCRAKNTRSFYLSPPPAMIPNYT